MLQDSKQHAGVRPLATGGYGTVGTMSCEAVDGGHPAIVARKLISTAKHADVLHDTNDRRNFLASESINYSILGSNPFATKVCSRCCELIPMLVLLSSN